jgi:hypothetical protein
MVLKTNCYSLVLNFSFIFFKGIAKKGYLCITGEILLLVEGLQSVLAIIEATF